MSCWSEAKHLRVGIEHGCLASKREATTDDRFGESLLTKGSRTLSGFALSEEARAAIASGDIAWIEKEVGELSPQERDWLNHRLEAENC